MDKTVRVNDENVRQDTFMFIFFAASMDKWRPHG